MARQKYAVQPSDKLFADDQRDLFEKSYEERLQEEKNKAVECLGMTFENDEQRREYFLENLREKLKDPEFRKIEGFPIEDCGKNVSIGIAGNRKCYAAHRT
ncbi:MAG: hypothetical protein IMY74_01515 [Bacteroidetes bacterium]|nr:hypothetical protein [Bacteroidota bacterium]